MLLIRFFEKGIKEKTLDDLFPFNNKVHQQQTRKPDIFKILPTRTERTKKSSVIFAQRELNKKLYN